MNKNIILIGMPGSDKTTIGKILSEKLGLKYMNTDQYISDRSSKSMPELISDENANLEILTKERIETIFKNKSSIISTEVDVIKNHLNTKELKENGVIIFIDKPVEKIIEDQEVLNNRSLLKNEVIKLHEHFQKKYETYRKCCHLHLVNNNNIDEIVHYICSIWS